MNALASSAFDKSGASVNVAYSARKKPSRSSNRSVTAKRLRLLGTGAFAGTSVDVTWGAPASVANACNVARARRFVREGARALLHEEDLVGGNAERPAGAVVLDGDELSIRSIVAPLA